MKPLLRTLAVLAALALTTQTVRHAYLLWFEPRSSALDKYDRPLKNEIEAAGSLEELLQQYDVARKDVDRVKAERRATNPQAEFGAQQDSEPFRSERALREAVTSWEDRAKEIRSLRFYWCIGFLFSALGLVLYLKLNAWAGLTFMIIGFSEAVYWTSPTFLGAATREFDRLLVHKLVLSVVSIVALTFAIYLLRIFRDERGTAS